MNDLTKKYIKNALGVTLSLVCALILTVIVLTVIPLFENADKTPVEGSAEWMKALDNDSYISDVVLPGTHDSASYRPWLPFFSRCQSFDIAGQLERGYRFLDIRLEAKGDDLVLVHNFTKCRNGLAPWSGTLKFDTVLDQCYAFVNEHPTEFIVLAVKQDHGNIGVGNFESFVKSYIDKNPDQWLLTDNLPTVGQARGKIVLMRRYSDALNIRSASGISFIWKDQNNRENTTLAEESFRNGPYMLVVQDRFKYGVEDKWAAFLKGNDAAGQEMERRKLTINYLSTNGDATYGHPYRYAKKLNEKLLSADSPALSGWVITDFGTAKLAERIYRSNFN